MAKEFAKKFYASSAWHKARDAYIAERMAIDGGMCERCHKRPGYIVHHIIELTPDNINDPDITLNKSNFAYWCKPCHDDEHLPTHDTDALRKITFDDDGNPICVNDDSPPLIKVK
jgi:5-methylcytosine-specific restriction protein A